MIAKKNICTFAADKRKILWHRYQWQFVCSTKGLEAFYALREKARRNGLQGVSLDDINDEISSARDEH